MTSKWCRHSDFVRSRTWMTWMRICSAPRRSRARLLFRGETPREPETRANPPVHFCTLSFNKWSDSQMTVFKVFHVSLQKTRFLKTKKSPVLLRPPQRELTRSSAFWVSDKTSAASLDSILQVRLLHEGSEEWFFPFSRCMWFRWWRWRSRTSWWRYPNTVGQLSFSQKLSEKNTSVNSEVKLDGCSLYFTDKVDDSLDDLLDDLEHKQKTTKKTEPPSSPAAPQKTETGERAVTSHWNRR